MNFLRRFAGRWDSADPDLDFLDLLAAGGLAAYERQLAFSGMVGDRDWLLDQATATLRLGDDLVMPAQILGSVSDGSGTWLWAWANPSVEPSMTTAAERARALGQERNIAVLVQSEVAIGRIGDGRLLALAVADALGAEAYYECPYEGGTAYVLVERLDLSPSQSTTPARRASTVVRAAIADIPTIVSRRAIEVYLARIGAAATVEDRRIAVAEGPTFTFDGLGHLTGIEEEFGLRDTRRNGSDP